jgi:hypothetical protein
LGTSPRNIILGYKNIVFGFLYCVGHFGVLN